MDHLTFAQLLGNYGEFLGAIVIVVTVAYLAAQVRYAKQATIDQNILSRGRGVQEQMLSVAQNEQLRMNMVDDYELTDFYQALASARGVTIEQASQIDWSNAYWFWVHWAQWKTTHDEKSLAELKHLIGYFYSMPTMLRTWEQSPWGKPLMDEEFVEFVDFVLSEQKAKQESGN